MNLDFSDPAVITAISSAAGALGSIVLAVVSAIKTHKLKNALDKAKQRETYTVCPRCKKKVPLSELSFYLVDGSKDDNLNGVPDLEE